jgi:uncharacterized membrane protein
MRKSGERIIMDRFIVDVITYGVIVGFLGSIVIFLLFPSVFLEYLLALFAVVALTLIGYLFAIYISCSSYPSPKKLIIIGIAYGLPCAVLAGICVDLIGGVISFATLAFYIVFTLLSQRQRKKNQ